VVTSSESSRNSNALPKLRCKCKCKYMRHELHGGIGMLISQQPCMVMVIGEGREGSLGPWPLVLTPHPHEPSTQPDLPIGRYTILKLKTTVLFNLEFSLSLSLSLSCIMRARGQQIAG
jgi:hypothetical protein